jgi:phosphatidate phosphatase APP1
MFPKQRFVLYGDNSQHDPEIYAYIANQFPQNVLAIYIRCVNLSKKVSAQKILNQLNQAHIHTLLFDHTREAMLHSASIGLLVDDSKLSAS